MAGILMYALIGLLAIALGTAVIALLGSRQDQTRAHQRVQQIQSKLKSLQKRHRKSQEKLRRYLQLMDTLINTIPNPIYYKDLEGVYRGCNKAFAREILGLTRDCIIGCLPQDLDEQIPSDLAALYRRHEKRLSRHNQIGSFEAKVPCADGETRDFLFSIAALTDEEEQISGSVGVMLDLTERNRAARSQLQNEKLQGVLETAGAVCHELNQPLQIASGHIEMALLDGSKKRPLADLAAKLRSQIERMATITSKLQNITRYETKGYPGNKRIIDIHKASSEKAPQSGVEETTDP
jgi:PAS domain S-box-containing protein